MKKIELSQDEARAEYQMATCYADLSPKRTMQVLRLAYCEPQTPETQLKVWSLVFVAPADVKKILLLPQHRDELVRLLEQTEWVSKMGIEKRPMDGIAWKGAKYCLPDEDLRLVSTGEFITAVTYLLAFTGTAGSDREKSDFLNRFLATICRPKLSLAKRLKRDDSQWNGDNREAFNSFQIDARAERFRSVNLSIKVAIMQWFLAAVGRAERLYGMPAPEKSEAPIPLGSFLQDWEKTVHGLAREGNFGQYDGVMDRSIHDVLAYLELRKIDNDEQPHETKSI